MKVLKNLNKKHYYFLLAWVILNVIQSVFTHLHPDEAYYWMYSRQLDWGFFDHPPMAAFFIFLGDSIMHNELGVRLFMILLSTGTLAMLLNELNEKKDVSFLFLFVLSFPLVHTHIGGFLALPDVPLVFFTLLFFIIYKRFVVQPNLKYSLLLAVVGAAMIYSKYHAFLILGLIALSNLRLLLNKYFWLAVFGIIILLIPHILWQFENSFPTISYHLIGRTQSISFNAISNNLISQIAVAGPLSGFIVLFSLTKLRTKGDLYKRAILFTILGFYIVLTIMSFWNWIEAHWTVAMTPMLMIATFPIISENEKLKLWFKRLAFPLVILFFVFRFYLTADFIPNTGYVKLFFYKQEQKVNDIKEMAGDLKIASFNNFDFPGSYEFYTGEKVVHMATPNYRYCQYDLWDEENDFLGDSLFVIYPASSSAKGAIRISSGQYVTTGISPKFQPLKGMKIRNIASKNSAKYITYSIELENQSGRTIYFNHPSEPAFGVYQNNKEIELNLLSNLTGTDKLSINEKVTFQYTISKDSIDANLPYFLYSRTIEKNRGEMHIVKPAN